MKLVFTSDAIDDIQYIVGYIRKVYGNKTAAKRIKSVIVSGCRDLKQYPLLGVQLSGIFDCASDLRYIVCENWIAFYQVTKSEVRIIRVLDGRSDYLKVLLD